MDTSNTDKEPFKVFIRLKPIIFNDNNLKNCEENELLNINCNNKYIDLKEDKNYKDAHSLEGFNCMKITDPSTIKSFVKKEKTFYFDGIFDDIKDNSSIFKNIVKPMTNSVLNGVNSSIIAYGVTGTGKTHTMFGDIYEEINFEKGISIYAIEHLFNKIKDISGKKINDNREQDKLNILLEEKKFKLKVSYLEIYNEQVKDLLNFSNINSQLCNNNNNNNNNNLNNEVLMIVEDSSKGIAVPNLKEYEVDSSKEVIDLIIKGNKKRTMAATGSNQFSSRSHAIFQILIEQSSFKVDEHTNKYNLIDTVVSKFMLVDLAGSERGGLEKGIRTHEGSNINKSLLALGNCINILSDKSKKNGVFVPYRDSKLTRLLKESLSGNISTVMISCISQLPTMYDETLNTLKYSSKARKIEKKVIYKYYYILIYYTYMFRYAKILLTYH